LEHIMLALGIIVSMFGIYAVGCFVGRNNSSKKGVQSTITKNDYKAALKVYLEYRNNDKNYSTGGFVEFCENRIHSE